MDFSNEFRVSLPVEEAWALLTDVERIAPCMPGAQLTGADGDTYNGIVKVKVGPVTVQYKGVASFEEKDSEARTAVLHARGRDVRGQGNADARVTARLVPDGDGTRVTVQTRLTITGRVAQFGKGMIEEVSRKLLAQFVDNLEQQLQAERQQGQATADAPDGAAEAAATDPGKAPDAAPPAEPTAPEPRPETGAGTTAVPSAATAPDTAGRTPAASASPAAEPEQAPLHLMSVARGAVLKRAVPVAVVLAVVVFVLVVWLA